MAETLTGPQLPQQPEVNQRALVKRRNVLLALIPATVLLVLFLIFLQSRIQTVSDSGADASVNVVPEQGLTLGELQQVSPGDLAINEENQLVVNGRIVSNGAFVLSGGEEPTNPQAGEVYFDLNTNDIRYYDGTQFISLIGENEAVTLPQDLATTATPTFAGLTLSGPLAVTQGGTGVTNFTLNGVLIGNGTGPLSVTAAPSPGQVLISNAAGVPVFQTIGGDLTVNSSAVASLAANSVAASELVSSGVTAGTYGSGVNYAVITVDDDGRVTSASELPLPGGGGGVTALNALTGALTLAGTANQINVVSGGTTITLSTPQDIAATSSPTFASPTFTGTLSVQGATVTVGGAAQAGSLILNDGSTNTGTVQTAALGQNSAFTIPDPGGVADTFCLLTLNNCSGSAQNLFETINAPNGTDPVADSTTDTLNFADGTNVTVTGTAATDTITIAVIDNPTFAGLVTLNGNALLQNGDTFTINGDAFDDLTGNGLAISSGDLGLGALTANWNQTGAFDISLNNASSELQILESVGGTFFGSIDVGDLTANRTYTFPDATGDVCLSSGNCVGAGGSAPNDAQYITLALDGDLTAERVLNPGTSLTVTDNGANGNYDINTVQDIRTTASPTFASPTFTGTLAVQGASVTVGTASTTNGSLVLLNSTNAFGVTLNAPSQTVGSATISFPNTSGVADTICLSNLANCAGTAQNLFETINAPNGTDPVADSATDILNFTDGTNITITGTAGTDTIDIAVVDSPTFAGNLAVNGNTTLGNATSDLITFTGTVQGGSPIIFEGATANTFETTLGIVDPTADITYRLPDASAGTYDICTTAGNCIGAGGGAPADAQYLTLALNGSLTAERVLNPGTSLTVTDGGANGNYDINTIQDIRTTASPQFNSPTFTGTLAVQGASVTVGTASTTNGSLVLQNSTNAFAVTLNAPSQTVGSATISFPNTAGVADTICLSTLANCAGTAQNLFETINAPNGTDPVADSATDTLNFTDGTNITVTGTAATDTIDIAVIDNPTFATVNTGNGAQEVNTIAGFLGNQNLRTTDSPTFASPTFTGTLAVQGATVTAGTASTTNGGLVLLNSTNAFGITIQAASQTVGSATISLPDTAGVADTFCLSTLANCAGAAATLQSAYNAGNTITTTDARDIDITLANTTTDSNFDIDIADGSTSTVSISRLNGAGTDDPSQLLLLENLDTDRTISNGITIQAAAGGISDAIDVSDAELTNAINIGANTILGTSGVIDFINFDVNSSGDTSVGGTLTVVNDAIFDTDTLFVDVSANLVGVGTSSPGGILTIDGDRTDSSWTTSGIQFQVRSGTFTDSSTAASGTATSAVFNSFGTPTLAASNASVTTTDAATVYIQGAPTAGTNQTITNAYALWVDGGDVRFDGALAVQGASISVGTAAQQGSLILNDGSSNTGTLQTAALGQNSTYTLPDPGGASADICLSTGNCVGGGGGSAPASAQYLTLALDGSLTAERVLNPGTSLTVTDGGANGNYDINTIQDIRTTASPTFASPTFTGTLAVQGASVTVGTASTTNGSLILQNSTNAFAVTLNAASQTVGSATVSFPDTAGAGDTVCLATLGNCVGGGGGGAPNSAAYLTVGSNATLTAERAITAGTNLNGVDGGANSTYTLNVVDNPTFAGLVTLNAGLSAALADTENIAVTNTVTGTNAVNLLSAVLTNNSSSGTQRVGFLQNAAGTGVTEALFALDNADTDTAVTDGLIVTSAAGTITDAIDVSDAEITNAINIGANTILGTTGAIDFTNFDVDSSGNVTAVGTLAVQGASVTIGGAAQTGSLIINDGSSNTGTIQTAALGQNSVFTVPDPGGATDTFCLLSLANCAGTAQNLFETINTPNGTDPVADSATDTLNFTDGANIIITGTAASDTIDIAVANSPTFSGTGTFQGASVTVGTASTTNGSLVLQNSTNAFTTTINAPNQTVGSATISLPNTAGVADTFCLSTLANCAGAAATLQSAYNNGNTIVTTDNRDIDITLANTTTDSDFTIDIVGTGNVFAIQDAGVATFQVADGGSAFFQTEVDSTTGFQILDTDGGTPILNVDTTNERVGIGTNAPDTTLDVHGVLELEVTKAWQLVPVSSGNFFSITESVSNDGLHVFENSIHGGAFSATNGSLIEWVDDAGSTSSTENVRISLRGTTDKFDIYERDGGDTVFRVLASGNVGINDLTPDARLDVEEASTNTTADTLQGTLITVTDTGVVTTGTDTTEGLQLQVTRTGATGGTINTTGLDLDVTGDTGGTSTAIGLDVNVSGADTNYAAIFQGGNVGIGTNAPLQDFEVRGSGNVLRVAQSDSAYADFGVRDGGSLDDDLTIAVTGNAGTSYFVFGDDGRVILNSPGSNTPADALLDINGDDTASAWGTAGIQLQVNSGTFTDSSTAASGTATSAVFNSFGTPTLAASNASVTTTDAATVYIQGAPTAGTNQTITNAYALWVDSGTVRFDDNVGIGTGPDADHELIIRADGEDGSIQIRAGSGVVDPYIYFTTGTGSESYTLGLDDSDSQAFVLSHDATLGTDPIFRATTADILFYDAASFDGDVTLGNAPGDNLTFTGTIQGTNALAFEGVTSNGFETTLGIVDPTADATIRLPALSAGTYDLCTTSGNCAGVAGNSLQQAYDVGNTITTTDARDIDITLANTTTDSNFDIDIADGSTSTVSISRLNGAGTADPAQLLLLENLDTDRAVTNGILLQAAAGGLTDAIDASDSDITNAINIGANTILGTTGVIDFTNFDLDGTGNITVDTNTFVVDATNNEVGIGTTSPDQALEVEGGADTRIRVSTNTANDDAGLEIYNTTTFRGGILYDGATTTTGIYGPNSTPAFNINAANDVNFDSNTLVVDESADSVGIGTATPAQKLEVIGTGATRTRIASSAANTVVGLELYNSTGTTFRGGFLYSSSSSNTEIYGQDSGTPALTITSANLVTASGALVVNGNTTIGNANTDTLTINAGSSGTGISLADTSFANCSALETVANILTCGSDAGGSSPWTTDTNVVNLVTDGDQVTVGSNTSLAKLAVDGDTAAEIQLLVQGAGSQTADLLVAEDSAGADLFVVDASGNTTINGNLDIVSPSSGSRIISGRFNDDFSGVDATTYFQNSTTNANTYLNIAPNGTGTVGGIILHSQGVGAGDKAYIEYNQSSGFNIIATDDTSGSSAPINLVTKPSSGSNTNRLTIAADGTTTFNPTGTNSDFSIQGDNNASLFYLDAGTDRIGIGDATPDALLDVEESSTSTTADTLQGALLTVADTGVVTTGTDTTLGQLISVTRTGATGGTINNTGLDINVTGDTGGTSTNIGLDVNVSGADTNYAAVFQGGNVGIGTATPSEIFQVSGSSSVLGSFISSGNSNTRLEIGNVTATWSFGLLGNEDFIINNGGNSGLVIEDGVIDNALFVDSSGDIGIGVGSTDAILDVNGSRTRAAWGANGAQLQVNSGTFTDSSTAASGTATSAVFNSFGTPTLAASNASVTTTDAATVYIQGAPTAGTNQTITNAYALWVDGGDVRFDDSITLGDATGDTITFTGRVNSNIEPSADDTYDLGSNALRWRDLYLGPATLHIGTTTGDEGTLTYDTTANALVLNEAGGNIDLRVEGDTNQNLLFLDAGNEQVGIGTNTTSASLTIQGAGSSSSTTALQILNTNSETLLSVKDDGSASFGADRVGAETLGETTVGGSENSGSSNLMNAAKVTTDSDGINVTSISVYIGAIDSNPNDKFEVAIYDATGGGGEPGSLVAESEEGTLNPNTWNTLSISATLSGSTDYWLAYNTNGTASGDNNWFYDTGGDAVFKSQTYGTWPSTYGSSDDTENRTYSIYASGTSSAGAFNIGTNGNIGFGTVNPDASSRLTVSASGTATYAALFNGGNVGIGTSAPEALLEVQGAEGTDAVIVLDADDGDNNSDTWSIVSQAAGNELIFRNHNTDRVTIDNNGDATFTAALTVQGNTTIGNAASDTLTITADLASNLIPDAAGTRDLGATTAEFSSLYLGDGNGLTLGLDQDATLAYDETTDDRVELTGSGASLFIEDRLGLGVQTLTLTDDGTANDTLTPTSSYVRVDADETGNAGVPDLVLSEASADDGDLLIIVNNEQDASNDTFTITQSAGVVQLPGATNITLGPNDSITLIYMNDRWVTLSSSDN